MSGERDGTAIASGHVAVHPDICWAQGHGNSICMHIYIIYKSTVIQCLCALAHSTIAVSDLVEDQVSSIAVAPNGDYFVTASADHTIRVWNLKSGEVRLHLRTYTPVLTLFIGGCGVLFSGRDYIKRPRGEGALRVPT